MLGLSAVVNAYPYRVPRFVPEILVDVVRAALVFDGACLLRVGVACGCCVWVLRVWMLLVDVACGCLFLV